MADSMRLSAPSKNPILASPLSSPRGKPSPRPAPAIAVSTTKGRSKVNLDAEVWYSYTVLRGPVDANMLTKWEKTVAAARRAGQFSCALMIIDDDYYLPPIKGEFFIRHDKRADLLDWEAKNKLHLAVYVPFKDFENPPTVPKYPKDYREFGYLMARWFEPLTSDAVPEPKKIDIVLLLDDFDKVRINAQMAGQMECKLMTIVEDVDYFAFEEDGGRQYRLDDRFKPAKDWAQMRGLRLVIKVPTNPFIGVASYITETPCKFGYLLGNWEVPYN